MNPVEGVETESRNSFVEYIMLRRSTAGIKSLCIAALFMGTFAALTTVNAQINSKDKETSRSIGGKEHEMNIYGVQIGMDVPTALQNVFINANRKPGQERPDAKKSEGKDNKDIRVVYKGLPEGELQIVFAGGKYVKEIVLRYAQTLRVADLRLPNSSSFGEAASGDRFDDRYTIGFVDNRKQEKLWWREEDSGKGYKIRLTFLSGNATKDTTMWWQSIVQKAITAIPREGADLNELLGKQ